MAVGGKIKGRGSLTFSSSVSVQNFMVPVVLKYINAMPMQ